MARFSTTISETPDGAEMDMAINHKPKSHVPDDPRTNTNENANAQARLDEQERADKPEEAGGKGSPDSVNPAPGHPGLRPHPGESHGTKHGGYSAEGLPPGTVKDPTGEHGSPGPDPYVDAAAATGEYDRRGRKIESRDGVVEPVPPPWQQDQGFTAMEKNPPASTLEEVVAPLSDATKAEMTAGRAAIGAGPPDLPDNTLPPEGEAGRDAGKRYVGEANTQADRVGGKGEKQGEPRPPKAV